MRLAYSCEQVVRHAQRSELRTLIRFLATRHVRLSPLQQRTVQHFMDSKEPVDQELADELGVTRQAVSQARAIAFKQLRKGFTALGIDSVSVIL